MTNRITPFFLLAFTLLFARPLSSQLPTYQWVFTGGSNGLYSDIRDLYVAQNGNVNSIRMISQVMYITQRNASGTLNWTKSISGSSIINPHEIIVDDSNNVYIAGSFFQTVDFDPGPGVASETSIGGGADVFLLKLDSNGTFIWVDILKSNAGEFCFTIEFASNGDIMAVGQTSGVLDFDPGPGTFTLGHGGGYDAYLWVVNPDGSLDTAYVANDLGHSSVYEVHTDALGNIYLAGFYDANADLDLTTGTQIMGSNGGWEGFIAKYDSSMNFLWVRTLGDTGNEQILDADVDAAGNIYGLGTFNSPILDADPGPGVYNVSNPGADDILIFKWDAGGNFIWAHNFGSPNVSQEPRSIEVSPLGQIYVTGGMDGTVDFSTDTSSNFYTVAGGDDMFLFSMDPSGQMNWVTQFGSTNNDRGNSCMLSPDGGSLLVGGYFKYWVDFDPGPGTAFKNSVGESDYFVLKLGVCQPSPNTVMTDSACGSYTWYGQTYSSSGTYTHALTNAGGCDSTLQLDLTILQPTAETLNESACDSYTLNGQTYNSSGTYTQTLSNAAGCDSVITLNLTVNTATSETLNESTCDNYTLNGQTYSSSGTFTQTLANMAGCDSVITLNLTVITVDTSVSTITQGLSANATGATYQWLDCDNSMAAISGQSNQFFFPTQDGNYAVAVTQNGCTDTSACHEVLLTALDPGLNASHITLTPNPTEDGRIKVSLQGGLAFDEVEILDLQGRVLRVHSITNQAEFQLELPGSAGMYILRFKDEKQSVSIRASRL